MLKNNHHLIITMKQLKLIAITALLSLSLFSCSENGPEVTAEKFINLTNQGDFAEAKKLGTKNTAEFLSMLESMLGDQRAEMKEKNKDLKIEIISTDVKDDTAKVTYKVTGGGEGKDQHLDLVKINGEWKADINLQNAMGTK